MIARLLWIVAMIAIAAVTSYAQLDRQARISPKLAPRVPEPFRAFAQSHVAATAIAGKDPERALSEAERLVERRPIPAEHLRLLASAQVKAGAFEDAATTIQLAARRGWRDPQTQEAMLRLALAADDTAEAARRYAALLQSPASDNEVLLDLGPLVFGDPGSAGRRVFAEIVANDPRWRSRLLQRGRKVMPPEVFAEIAR